MKLSKNYEPKSFSEKKQILKDIIANHNEFSKETKIKIEETLIKTFDTAHKLRERESKLIQEIMHLTIVKKAKYEKLVELKKELKKTYASKYNNFDKGIKELKKIIGIKQINEKFYDDLPLGYFFGR